MRQNLVKIGLEFNLAPGRGQIGDRLPLIDGINRWDGLNAELRGNRLIAVNVDLDQRDALRRIGRHDLLEHRRQGA